MTDQPLQRSKSGHSRPVIRAFVAVAALLVAAVVVSAVLSTVLDYVTFLAETSSGPASRSSGNSNRRVMFATILAGIGVAMFGVWSLLFRRRSDSSDQIDGPTLFTIAGVIGAILFVFGYLLTGSVDQPIPSFVQDLVDPITMGGLAVGYLQYRDVPLHIALPSAEELPTVLGAGAVAVIAGIAPVVLSPARGTVFGSFFYPSVGLLDILASVGIIGLVGGAGFGLLYNAAIQRRLGTATRPAHAVVAVTGLVGVRSWARPELQVLIAPGQRQASSSLFGPSIVATLGAIIVGVLAAWVFVRAVQTISQAIERDVAPVLAGAGVVGLLSIAVIIASVIRGYGIGFVWGVTSLSAVVAAGSIGYERTRSVWVPALAFGIYWLLVDSAVTQLLFRVFG